MKFQELVNTLGDKFIASVEEQLLVLAYENPDFVYKPSGTLGTCLYDGPAVYGIKTVGPECTGCIFGQAFQRLGWETSDYIGGTVADITKRYGIQCPLTWNKVQKAQDEGATWKNAVSFLDV